MLSLQVLVAAAGVALSLASYAPSGYGPPPPPPGPNPYDIKALVYYALDVEVETDFLSDRSASLKEQQQAALERLGNLLGALDDLKYVELAQNKRIIDAKLRYKELTHVLGDLEADVAKEGAITNRLGPAAGRPLGPSIMLLRKNNNKQDQHLAELATLLDETIELVTKTLGSRVGETLDDIDTSKDLTKDLAATINRRKCGYVERELVFDGDGPATLVAAYPFDFSGQTPDVFCGIQGISTDIGKSFRPQTYGGGYGHGGDSDYHADRFTQLSYSVSCQPRANNVLVVANDLSRGAKVGVNSVYVLIKSCTLGPVAGAP